MGPELAWVISAQVSISSCSVVPAMPKFCMQCLLEASFCSGVMFFSTRHHDQISILFGPLGCHWCRVKNTLIDSSFDLLEAG